MSLLAPTLQLFFGERMAKQRQASPATITSYRNTFRLLLGFVQNRTGKAPSTLDWNDLDVDIPQNRGGMHYEEWSCQKRAGSTIRSSRRVRSA